MHLRILGICALKYTNLILQNSMKDELGRKIITKFVGLRAKTYSYLIDDDNEVCHKKKT